MKRLRMKLLNTSKTQKTEVRSMCHDKVGNYAEVKVKDGKVIVVCNFKKHVAPENIIVNPKTYFKPIEKPENPVEILERKVALELEKEVAKSVRTDWHVI